MRNEIHAKSRRLLLVDGSKHISTVWTKEQSPRDMAVSEMFGCCFFLPKTKKKKGKYF